jgi:hypothetical protein
LGLWQLSDLEPCSAELPYPASERPGQRRKASEPSLNQFDSGSHDQQLRARRVYRRAQLLGGDQFRPPLAELSDLLGVTVIGVRRIRVTIDRRPQLDPNAWELLTIGLDDQPRWLDHVLSRHLRDGWWLTALAQRWGRDPELPPLTRADGRRALRLMHEATEKTNDTKGATT